MATLVPSLDALRSEFNRNFPRRDKASDGWIGDPAHQAGTSDHNPDANGIVHAIDVDEDLRAPGATMRECVDEVVRRHRVGADNRLTYVIYERVIWSASHDWRPRVYTGSSNPHDKHAHFSARRGANSRGPFGIEDIVTQADRDDIVRRVTAEIEAAIRADNEALIKDVVAATIRADVDWSDGKYSLAGAVFDAKKHSGQAMQALTRIEGQLAAIQAHLALDGRYVPPAPLPE